MEKNMPAITKPVNMSEAAWGRARAEVAWLAIPGNTIGGAAAAIAVSETVIMESPGHSEVLIEVTE